MTSPRSPHTTFLRRTVSVSWVHEELSEGLSRKTGPAIPCVSPSLLSTQRNGTEVSLLRDASFRTSQRSEARTRHLILSTRHYSFWTKPPTSQHVSSLAPASSYNLQAKWTLTHLGWHLTFLPTDVLAPYGLTVKHMRDQRYLGRQSPMARAFLWLLRCLKSARCREIQKHSHKQPKNLHQKRRKGHVKSVFSIHKAY